MVNQYDLSPWLRGKSPEEQSRLAQAIMAASREGRFPLSDAHVRRLSEFILQIHMGLALDDALLMEVSDLRRQFEQHLLDRARGKP